METTLKSPTSNEKKSLTLGKNTSHRGNDAQCPTFPSRQTVVQAKLELTTPGDSYEQEADRMADHVMRSAFSVSDGDGQGPRQTMSRPIVSRRSSGSGGVAVDSQTESDIMSSRGGGSSLPTALRSRMETGFGADFSNVRIHNDATAASLSNSIQAKAFTYGNDIYFNRGQYSLSSSDGQRLIAHELTHTLQQTGRIGRAPVKGRQWGKEMETFNDLSFKDIFNFPTTSPYLLRVINFARFVSKGKNGNGNQSSYTILDNVLPSDNISFYYNDNFTGKHLIYFYDKYVQNNSTNSSISRSDYLLFFDYVDLVCNGIEDNDYVLEKMRKKSLNNLTTRRRRDDGNGITIAILTDEDTGGEAFKNKDYKKGDKDDYSNLYDNNDYFFLLQGLSLEEYAKKIKLLIDLYGPLQNLIISGHGNWDRISLDNDALLVTSEPNERPQDYDNLQKGRTIVNARRIQLLERQIKDEKEKTMVFFDQISNFFRESNKFIPRSKQSIFLEACLTNSIIIRGYPNKEANDKNAKRDYDPEKEPRNFAETLRKKVGEGIQIWAYSSLADTKHDIYYLSNGSLMVRELRDEPRLGKHHKTNSKDYFFSRTFDLGNQWFEIWDENQDNLLTLLDYFSITTLYNFIEEIKNPENKSTFYDDYKGELIVTCEKIQKFIRDWISGYREQPKRATSSYPSTPQEWEPLYFATPLAKAQPDILYFRIFIREFFYQIFKLSGETESLDNFGQNQSRRTIFYDVLKNANDYSKIIYLVPYKFLDI